MKNYDHMGRVPTTLVNEIENLSYKSSKLRYFISDHGYKIILGIHILNLKQN